MVKFAQAMKGARRLAGRVLRTQGRRTAERSVAAVAAGREPGKPGRKRTVVGSLGGKNGARAADRAAACAAKKAGIRPKRLKRLQRPAGVRGKALARSLRLQEAAGNLHLLEVCAYKKSALAHDLAGRRLARRVLRTQGRRTAERRVAALTVGHEPGKPGPKRTVVGSLGGKNGARNARRAAARAAKKAGICPKPAERLQPPAGATGKAMLQKPAAAGNLHLLEVCAYKNSALAREWAERGYAAVRVARRRKGGYAKPGPEPVLGRAQTWYLDLDEGADRDALMVYAAKHSPADIWTSPDCTSFTSVQRINRARCGGRPRGEKASLDLLAYIRELHAAQLERGGRCHHEQSASSRAPFDSNEWPWAISTPPVTVKVAGCAVGLKDRKGEKLLGKEWRVESTSWRLLVTLEPYKCPGGHVHGSSLGSNRLWRTAIYTAFFAQLIATALLAE